jgi:hypothetical protein
MRCSASLLYVCRFTIQTLHHKASQVASNPHLLGLSAAMLAGTFELHQTQAAAALCTVMMAAASLVLR